MIIDAHCHMVPTEEGIRVTEERMTQANVDHTLIVPGGMVPLLGLGDFLRGRIPLQIPAARNDFNADLIRTRAEKFSALFQFDPSFHDESDVEAAIDAGFSGFKLNPLVDRVSFAAEALDMLCEVSIQRSLPLYTHITLSGEASLDALTPLLQRHPALMLILGHMGFASSDAEAIRLARRFDGVLLETSVGAFHAIHHAVKVLGTSKILFGSEGPAHHPGSELHKLKLLNLSESDFERVVGGNIRPYCKGLRTEVTTAGA